MRRLAALGIDYLVIFGYLVVLAGGSVGVLASGLRSAYSVAWATVWSAEVMGFLMLTVPLVLYFAILESSTAGATLGKRALGLRVRSLDGRPLSRGQSLPRSAVKFLPWELAHFTIWHFAYATSAHAQPPAWTTISLEFVYVLVVAFLLTLIFGSHRTIYDRIAGSTVEFLPRTRAMNIVA